MQLAAAEQRRIIGEHRAAQMPSTDYAAIVEDIRVKGGSPPWTYRSDRAGRLESGRPAAQALYPVSRPPATSQTGLNEPQQKPWLTY